MKIIGHMLLEMPAIVFVSWMVSIVLFRSMSLRFVMVGLAVSLLMAFLLMFIGIGILHPD